MESFPAIFIGGPPHSGKSVLTYNLTRALRQRSVQHYVLRAAPDGEGDWANEAEQALVRTLRVKGDFTPAFTDFICRSLTTRHLPLIVDVGGRPTPYQERIFDLCTHAVLLAPDEDSLADWRAIAARHGVPVVAELISRLHGDQSISATQPILRGVITGLEWDTTIAGPVFDALVDCLASLLYLNPDQLYRLHERDCPTETVIRLDRLGRTLGALAEGGEIRWQPHHLPQVLDYLPEQVPLGLYGRAPNWLYAAVARLAYPADFHQFDVRLGWVRPPTLRLSPPATDASLQAHLISYSDHTRLEFTIPKAYLDYDDAHEVAVPPVPADKGAVLSGKLPLWLWTALGLAYAPLVPWLAVYQPQQETQAVVVSSRTPALSPGHLVVSPPKSETDGVE